MVYIDTMQVNEDIDEAIKRVKKLFDKKDDELSKKTEELLALKHVVAPRLQRENDALRSEVELAHLQIDALASEWSHVQVLGREYSLDQRIHSFLTQTV